jgi:hypothetical protein
MDKVFSTRLDEAVIDELSRLSRRLGISKKRILEEAVRQESARLREGKNDSVWRETSGAWKRRESPKITIRRIREAFEAATKKHHRQTRAR